MTTSTPRAHTFGLLTGESELILPELVAFRRDLHRHPELGMPLPRTRAKVLEHLDGLGLEITTSASHGGIVAVLRGASAGPTVLLRGDMDALPIVEATGLAYSSSNEHMHACGHDLHCAGLLGAARLLSLHRDDLAGNVLFMFQPGEETGDGARTMLNEGMLGAAGGLPDFAYGIHIVPAPYGRFSTRPGTIMAGSLELRVVVTGRGGHASAPHLTADPVLAIGELIGAFQLFANRRFDVFDPIVLTTTQVAAGGTATNIIAGEATLGASIRTLSATALEKVLAELPILIASVAAVYGCKADVSLQVLCPPTVNDAALTRNVRRELAEVFGQNRVHPTNAPVMGSEDFSYVLQQVPGTYMFLGATPLAISEADAAPNHSATVMFDDSILADYALALSRLALQHL